MESLKVKDYMNHRPVKLSPEMPVAEAVERLLLVKQTGGPVVDIQNQVIGFLSEQDCLSQMITSSYYREQVCLVEDIMISPVLSVKGESSIIELAQKMISERPKVYPVLDENGELLGSINRTEVLIAIDVQFRSGYKSKGK